MHRSRLRQAHAHARALPGLLHQACPFDARRRPAGQLQPLAEEALQRAPGRLLEGGAQFVPSGDTEALAFPEKADAARERVLADFVLQHHEDHRRLAVAHRGRGAVGARAEIGERCVRIRRQRGEVAQPAQAHLARRGGRRLGLVGVVGHEGGQPLRPVATRVVDQHAVAPPVVQHLVAERARADEGQAQHLLADVGQRGHAEAGRQRARHHRELGEGVGADLCRVALDVALAVGEVGLGQPGLAVERGGKVGAQAQRPAVGLGGEAFAHHPGPGHQVDAVCRMFEDEARAVGLARRGRALLVRQSSGDQRRLAATDHEVHLVGEEVGRTRIPAAATGEEAARRRGHRRHGLQHLAVVACLLERGQLAAVAQAQLGAGRRIHPPGAQRTAAARGTQRQRMPVGARGLRLQGFVQHEAVAGFGRTQHGLDLKLAARRIELDRQMQPGRPGRGQGGRKPAQPAGKQQPPEQPTQHLSAPRAGSAPPPRPPCPRASPAAATRCPPAGGGSGRSAARSAAPAHPPPR